MSKIKWNKGERGSEPRTSVCGLYVCEVVEYGCRHEPGLYWSARYTGDRDPLGQGWLTGRGVLTYSRYPGYGKDPGAGGLLSEAKESAQLHASSLDAGASS